MAVPDSLILASEVIGFISFGITLLTLVGVYADLIRTLRAAPTTIPIALGNLREEIRYEQRLCHHAALERKRGDDFHVFTGKRSGYSGRKEDSRLLFAETLRHLWGEFCDVERRFLVRGEKAWDQEDGSDEGDRFEEGSRAEEKFSVQGNERRRKRKRRGSSTREKKDRQDQNTRSSRPGLDAYRHNQRQSFIKSRMGWIEAGLSRDRTTYYNTDFAHRFLWWWKKDDVSSLMDQVQRIQIRRIERDAYESNELVKRALRIYGRRSGDDIFYSSDSGDDGGGRGGGGSGNDGGGNGGRNSHVRRSSGRHSNASNFKEGNYRRSERSYHNGSAKRGGIRQVSEREIIRRRRASSPTNNQPSTPRRSRSTAVAADVDDDEEVANDGGRRERPRRSPVVYEYEVVDPGDIRVEYGGPRPDQTWRQGRQRSYSRGR